MTNFSCAWCFGTTDEDSVLAAHGIIAWKIWPEDHDPQYAMACANCVVNGIWAVETKKMDPWPCGNIQDPIPNLPDNWQIAALPLVTGSSFVVGVQPPEQLN